MNFLAKGYIGVSFMIWLRWTLPRLRIDQVMTTCLKYCIPLSAAMFLGAMLWLYAFPGGVFDTLLATPRPVAARADCPDFRGGNDVALEQARH